MNVDVIGFGLIARRHVKAYRQIRDVRVNITAVCDKNEKLKEEVRKEPAGDVSFHTDPAVVLREHNLDLVHISTSSQTHAQLSILCREKGCRFRASSDGRWELERRLSDIHSISC